MCVKDARELVQKRNTENNYKKIQNAMVALLRQLDKG